MVKIKADQKIVKNFFIIKRLPEKTRGAKRARFLRACRGRIDRAKLRKN